MKIFYEVVEKIMDSRDVTVGGGSASAVAGAMAAGLVGMVSRLSVGKEYGLPDERYLEIAEELDELAVQLKEGVVEDTRSYLGIKAAFALPKATEEQKSARRAAIESAAIKAANVPLENGRAALRILEFCREMDGKFNPAASSDMEAGVLLAEMAVKDTELNVEANLSLIKTPEINEELARSARGLKAAVE
ncbi:MAG: cyclodeaminase/cyclohydrolase family protein [Synergistaceae bacterium]|nr:cyclodeaminase/cyclohydrolase family protein [Synergistaceae bacterium]